MSVKIQVAEGVSINAVVTSPANPTTNPTLVFLHYWGGSSKTWSRVTTLLQHEYPTMAIDFRGWGDSQGPPQEDAYSIHHLAADVETVSQKLKLENFILVGLSMGAKVSLLIAENASSNLRGLVLVSPPPPTPFQLLPEMREQQIHAYDNVEAASFVTENVLTTSRPSGELLSTLVSDQLRGHQYARAAWPSYAMAEDISGGLDNINVPSVILAAEKDVVEPLDRVTAEVHKRVKGSTLKVIQGSGHLSPIDSPEQVAHEIRTFAKSIQDHN